VKAVKVSFLHGPLTPARARTFALLNQFATPGLGSLLGRRWVSGGGQLLLAVAGFLLFCAWFINVLQQYYGLIDSDRPVHLHPGWAAAGVGVFALAWLWALVTSISLLREGRRNEREGRLPPL
jgi:hypothetical protein